MANDYLEIRELYHHGIKGQKWGVRRFQNEDGTLTNEGKERYGFKGEKKDSNGIHYASVKSKSDIEDLGLSMTVEGVNIKNDSDRKKIVDYLKSKKVNVDNLTIVTIMGKDMNSAFGLKGKNAYKDDFHIQSFYGLDETEAYNALKPLGCRWMDDIIYNNERHNGVA